LPGPFANQFLKAVGGRNSQVFQSDCICDDLQFALRDALDIDEPPNAKAACEFFCVAAPEGSDQKPTI
jgi:hypothetical protein